MPHFSKCCGVDEYLCQECGGIFCAACDPPKSFKIKRIGGWHRGSVCSNCSNLLHKNEKESH